MLGEQPQAKEQEVVGPAGHPSGLQHLHLAAVPHASLGMEVMEEIPEGETLHFQACLEDPEWGRAGSATEAQEAAGSAYSRPGACFLLGPPQGRSRG